MVSHFFSFFSFSGYNLIVMYIPHLNVYSTFFHHCKHLLTENPFFFPRSEEREEGEEGEGEEAKS